jgi:putative transposase
MQMTDAGDEPGTTPFGLPSVVPARRVLDELIEAGVFDEVLERIDERGLQLTGEGGFLPEMIKAVLERGLQAELTDHLGL